MKAKTFFIVPQGATATLSSDGWVFTSDKVLSSSVMDKIVESFKLPFVEEYLDIRKFQDEQSQLNAVFSPEGLLSEIYFRTTIPSASTRLRELLSDEVADILDAEVASQAA